MSQTVTGSIQRDGAVTLWDNTPYSAAYPNWVLLDGTRTGSGYAQNLSVDRFDPALGTLDKVTLTYNFDLRFSVSVRPGPYNCTTRNVGPICQYSLQNISDSGNLNNTVRIRSGIDAMNTGTVFDSWQDEPTGTLDTSVAGYATGTGIRGGSVSFSGADLDDFIGSGSFALRPRIQVSLTFNTFCGTFPGYQIQDCSFTYFYTINRTDMDATLTYEYTEATRVPLPSSIAALGAGLGALTVLTRRRRNG